jgi:flagellar L-ring protein precursor FlgH
MKYEPELEEVEVQVEKRRLWPFVIWTLTGLFLLLVVMSMRAQTVVPVASAIPLPVVPATAPLPAPTPKNPIVKLLTPKPSVATTSLNAYLVRVRAETSNAQPTTGSIWTDAGRLTRMNTDVRAMRPNDLISVVVSENLAASTDGEVKNSRASSASSQITSLFGLLKAGNALQNLIGQTSAQALNAQGASATNSSLTTVLGGQVVEVLANGTLVIEAERQVEFSQQTQTIVLHGLVRPEDISQQNQVLSTAISSLELEVRGKGIVNDATYRQNALVRLLERILIF